MWSTSELRVWFAPLNRFKPYSKIFYWPFQGGTSFLALLCIFCLVFAMPLWACVYMCLVVTRWERADLLVLVCGIKLWVCYFPIGILGQVWYLIVLILIFAPLLTLTHSLYMIIILTYLGHRLQVSICDLGLSIFRRPSVRRPSIHLQFLQTTSPPKPLGIIRDDLMVISIQNC